jgi:regulator of protease activity HflC (stomatin/prohibitin superfamily)
MIGYIFGFGIFCICVGSLAGIRIVRPTERAVIERLGKYNRFASLGFNYIIPIVERLIPVNITERMMEIESQEIITEDNLNAKVDLVVYYKVKEDEQGVKNSIYKVGNFKPQIIRLAQTTARNVIGTMPFKEVNSQRNKLNVKLADILKEETSNWGVSIVRVELKDITPPKEVQETMNQVIQAENAKRSAVDFATAKETEADGFKRSKIKEAEGLAQSTKIVADANAYKLKIENEAASKYFTGNAQKLKQLNVTLGSLKNNSKVILGTNSKDVLKLFNIDGDENTFTRIAKKKKE